MLEPTDVTSSTKEASLMSFSAAMGATFYGA